jgi:transposase-like protein
MSKIPPGEWSAIAARHAQGESLSAIARSYGCTPPAIHYVLKRNGQQTVETVEQPETVEKVEQPAEGVPLRSEVVPLRSEVVPLRSEVVPIRSSEPDRETSRLTLRSNGEIKPSPNRVNETADPNRMNETAGSDSAPVLETNGLVRSEQQTPTLEPQRSVDSARATGRPLTYTDGLDSELHQRAEAAIEAFRSCFEAALAEGSAQERARLREAASDLMRVAARTTIVLDRLNALSERAANRFDPRSNSNRPNDGPARTLLSGGAQPPR